MEWATEVAFLEEFVVEEGNFLSVVRRWNGFGRRSRCSRRVLCAECEVRRG